MKKTLLFLFLACTTSAGLVAQSGIVLNNAQDSASYAYGIVLANSIKRQLSSDLNRDVLIASLNAAMQDEPMQFSAETATKVFSEYNRAAQAKASEKVRTECRKFLEANKKRKEVATTASGLQYEVLKRGDGVVAPKTSDNVEVHYHATLINGDVVESSVERGQPITLIPSQVIAGWAEGLQLMHEGDKFKLYIPAELGYGDRGKAPKVKPGAALIYEVELLKIMGN